MEVIINGSDKSYTMTCNNCHSDLKYTKADVIIKQKRKEGWSVHTEGGLFNRRYFVDILEYNSAHIVCPVCGKEHCLRDMLTDEQRCVRVVSRKEKHRSELDWGEYY